MSLLVISEILELYVDILAVADKYSLCNKKNLTQPIQMKLSKKQKIFPQFFSPFLKFTSNLKHFERKMCLIPYVFLKLMTAKGVAS